MNNTNAMETATLTINDKMKKLLYRLKATQSLVTARQLFRDGRTEDAARMYVISRWYHEQAYRLGYIHPPFLKDYASVLEVCGKNEEARIVFLKASEEIKSAA